jgi:tight adherence protein C
VVDGADREAGVVRLVTGRRAVCRRAGIDADQAASRSGGGRRPLVGGAALVVGSGLVAGPPGLVVGGAAVGAVTWWRRRRAAAARPDLVADLPDVVDLLALSIGAGASTRHAVEAVARHGSGPLAVAFAAALRAVDQRGARLADELAAVPVEVGEVAGPVVRPIVASLRYGTPVGPTLALVGRDLRQLRRQRAEERLRRVPVQLLFPLVCCTLPAFVVLTIVPLLAGAFGDLHLS